MKKILTPEEKKYLVFISRMLQSYMVTSGEIEIDYDHRPHNFDAEDLSIEQIDSFSNNYTIEVPEQLKKILYKIAKLSEKEVRNIDVYDVNFARFIFEIDCEKNEITFFYYYNYYDTENAGGVTYSLSDDEDLKPIFDALEEEGISNDELRYNGSGDSGYIESTFESGKNVPAVVEDFCYSALESNFGGWEINEGSDGQFDFNMDDKEIYLNHRYNIEEYETITLFKEKF
jgi:hypothetical protein